MHNLGFQSFSVVQQILFCSVLFCSVADTDHNSALLTGLMATFQFHFHNCILTIYLQRNNSTNSINVSVIKDQCGFDNFYLVIQFSIYIMKD